MADYARRLEWLERSTVRTLTALLLLITLDAFAQSGAELKLEHDPRSVAMDAATPTTRVEAMLKMANVGPADFVIDLGSGDGRIVIAAVKDFGAKGALGVRVVSFPTQYRIAP